MMNIFSQIELNPNKVNLINQYYHESKKMQSSIKSDKYAKRVYQRKWFALHALNSLQPYTLSKATKSILIHLFYPLQWCSLKVSAM
jgi:hypothetical protein